MVQAEFTIRKEGGPALDDPVFLVQKVMWRLPLARRKVEIGNLVTIVIQEYFWSTVDQSAVFTVIEVLSPHWIILDVLYFCLQSLLHVILSLIVVVVIGIFDSLVRHLCDLLLPSCQLPDILLEVVSDFFPVQQTQVFDLTPGFVRVLVVVEFFVVGMASFVQVLEGSKDLTRPDVLLLLGSLVLLLTLQFDGYHSSLGFVGQPWQLFDSVHDVSRSHWNTDHSSFPRSPARFWQQHHLLEVDVKGDKLVLQLG